MDPRDAENLIGAMDRARELLGLEIEPPSLELQSRVLRAAVEQRASVTWSQRIGEGGRLVGYAIVETERGQVSEPVMTSWEDAWRATGLLD